MLLIFDSEALWIGCDSTSALKSLSGEGGFLMFAWLKSAALSYRKIQHCAPSETIAGESAFVRVPSTMNPSLMPGSSCVADVTLEDLRSLLNQREQEGSIGVATAWLLGTVPSFWCSRQE